MIAAALIAAAAAHANCTPADIVGPSREQRLVRARWMIAAALRDGRQWSSTQIGAALGGRHHVTILHGFAKTKPLILNSNDCRALYETLRDVIRQWPHLCAPARRTGRPPSLAPIRRDAAAIARASSILEEAYAPHQSWRKHTSGDDGRPWGPVTDLVLRDAWKRNGDRLGAKKFDLQFADTHDRDAEDVKDARLRMFLTAGEQYGPDRSRFTPEQSSEMLLEALRKHHPDQFA